MFLTDLSAIDKFIDFHGGNILVSYEDNMYSLYDLKEHLLDINKSMSLNEYDVTISHIGKNNLKIVSVEDLRKRQIDDLIDL